MKFLSRLKIKNRKTTSDFLKIAQYALPIILLSGLMFLRIEKPIFVATYQNRVFDLFQRIKPREYIEVPVRVIDIDEASLAEYGQWPWPRTLLAKLVERMHSLGAASIVFDYVFAEPDRNSPDIAVKNWPDTPELESLKAASENLPNNDNIFASAIQGRNVVTGFFLTNEFANDYAPKCDAFFAISGEEQPDYVANFSGATVNLPVIEQAAAGNGSFTFISEADGVIRQVPMMFRKGNAYLPSLSAEALRVAQGAGGYTVKFSGGSGEGGGKTGLSRIRIGKINIPTDAWGKVWAYFTKTAPQRTISAKAVLAEDAAPDMLNGMIAIIGTSAAGLKDLRVTPLNPVLPGVEVHANIIEQALLGQYLYRPDWADGAEYVYMIVVSLLLIALLPRMSALLCTLFGFFSVAAVISISWYGFASYGWLIDPVCPIVAVGLIFFSSLMLGYLKTELEKSYVRTAFSHYVNSAMVEELARNPAKLKLGGISRNMTILFCDIRGFTTISEQYDSVGLTRVINRFLTPMTAIIMERKGCIDKYIGDCIMAFWNAPIEDDRHMVNACEAALSMQEELAKLNKIWQQEAEVQGKKYLPINVGIGLNTDICCVGNLGSDQHFNYSVLGDGVNLASRLEGQSKNYGVGIVIGPKTYEGAIGFASLELDLIKVKGKTQPVHIYTILGKGQLAASPEFIKLKNNHNRMLQAYRSANFASAMEYLNLCRENPYGLEKLYALYQERINSFMSNPPAPDWDGTYTATSK